MNNAHITQEIDFLLGLGFNITDLQPTAQAGHAIRNSPKIVRSCKNCHPSQRFSLYYIIFQLFLYKSTNYIVLQRFHGIFWSLFLFRILFDVEFDFNKLKKIGTNINTFCTSVHAC